MPSRKPRLQGAGLTQYRDKRRASATAEPFGAAPARSRLGGGLFVVQQHRARHLHFDLRLEIDGVLRSWAVPKGPSANPADKRFAVLVEDHPIEYADFEGAIAPGNYGAGYVIVWDRGTWTPQNDFAEGWRKGKLLFDLHGCKLRGRWTLVRMHKADTEWLLIKERDGEARDAQHRYSDESILSGLELADVADLGAAERRLEKSLKRRAPESTRRAGSAPKPMLATAGEPFDRQGWLFEFKYDGYRLLAEKDGTNVRLLSRNAVSLTEQFPDIAKAVAMLPYRQLLIDGELVVNDATGRPSFGALQERAAATSRSEIADASRHRPATLYAFDLLEALDYDLRNLELVERKRILEEVLPTVGPVRYSQHVEQHGRAAFATAQRIGVEGIVGKRAASRYQTGRSNDWIKVRTRRTGDFVIVGWMPERSGRDDIGALILAEYRAGKLTPVGRVGSGLGGAQRAQLRAVLQRLPRGKALEPAGHWVAPQQVCEVAFREYTSAGHLRQPVFVRLRDDKRADECVGRFDEPASAPAVDAGERLVTVSHRDKVFFPELGFTKGDLIDYYDAIAPWMLPYLKDRPLVLTRFPDGIHGKSFYQRDAPEFVPDWIRRETLWSDGAEREVHYFVADDAASLRYLVNLGTIPIHTWHARVGDLAHPDWCVLDLDPKDAPFASVIRVARAIRDLAGELEMPAYLKTSGASGLHVLIPLGNQLTHEQSRTFAHLLARIIVDRCGAIATIARSVRRRDRKVYIDYLQNGHGRLLVAPFSARAESSAGVSMPLRWDELTANLRNDRFHIGNAPKRMRSLRRDPWVHFWTDRADLARTLERMTGLVR